MNRVSQHTALLVAAALFLAACGGGPGAGPTPTPTPPPAGNPVIGEPTDYSNGTLALRQPASTAYFVAVNHLESGPPFDVRSYTLTAEGTSPLVLAAPALPPSANVPLFGQEWRIVQRGAELAPRLPPAPRPWRPHALTAQVGSQRSFWVITSITPFIQTQITATLQAQGTRAYIYVDNNDLQTIDTQRAQAILAVFDQETWPRVTAVFGKPVNPYNPDGNGPNIILFSSTVGQSGFAGYFFAPDLFPDATTQQYDVRSNEASMFYLDANLSNSGVPSVSAHEFQHLINFSQKWFVYATTLESTWIDEGLSMVAMDVAGYGYQTNVQTPYAGSFFQNPDAVSLYNWGGGVAAYGAAWLFFRYVADRFTDAALTNIVQSNQVGVPNLERVTQEPVGRTLLYSGVAMMVSTEGLQITDPRWTYRSVSLANIGRITYGTTGTKNARSLGFNFVKVSSGGQPAVRVTVTEDTLRPLRPYAALAR